MHIFIDPLPKEKCRINPCLFRSFRGLFFLTLPVGYVIFMANCLRCKSPACIRIKQETIVDTEWIRLAELDEDGKASAIVRAGQIIREGGLVAFPTETVYGLGADALNEEAAARIYQAKGRPSDNPLIAHIWNVDQVDQLALKISPDVRKMMDVFWPGPLTIILPKKDTVPDGTTGGLPTVAIRMPCHPVAMELIRRSGCPIAAPSANVSGRPSPTRADHVYEDMKGRIPMILDGGPVDIGIESTIIDMSRDRPLILRPGHIRREELEEVLSREVPLDPAIAGREPGKNVVARAPGMKYRHYAPKADMTLVEGPEEAVISAINDLAAQKMSSGCRVGVIATEETRDRYRADVVRVIGSRSHPESVAAGLYKILREFDSLSCDAIYSESFFESGMFEAVMNRMLKAAGYHIMTVGKRADSRSAGSHGQTWEEIS